MLPGTQGMWRFGMAAALLLLLTALVVGMLFGDHDAADSGGSHATAVARAPAEPATRAGFPGQTQDGRVVAPTAPSPSFNVERAGLPGGGDANIAASDPSQLPDLSGLPSALPSDAATSGVGTAHEAPKPPAPSPGVAVAPQLTEPIKRPKPPDPAATKIAEAQRKLAALGYAPGAADGRIGRRTETAIREFQRDRRLKPDGRIDDRLIARLDGELRARAQLRQQEMEVMAPAAPRAPEKAPQRGIFGSVLGGFQRLLGRDFDSIRRPDEIAAYCRNNPDTWIYDFAREAFVYCGNVVAGEVSGRASAPMPVPAGNAETAATR